MAVDCRRMPPNPLLWTAVGGPVMVESYYFFGVPAQRIYKLPRAACALSNFWGQEMGQWGF